MMENEEKYLVIKELELSDKGYKALVVAKSKTLVQAVSSFLKHDSQVKIYKQIDFEVKEK